MPQTTPPTSIVIFGASGDLTQRKLVPALYNLWLRDRLDASTRIIGFARRAYSHDDFRTLMREGAAQFAAETFTADRWAQFATRLYYEPGNLNVGEDYARLHEFLREQEDNQPVNRLYYLATAPEFYATSVDILAAQNMADETHAARRLVIEKPFGHDLATAQELNRTVLAAFREHQVYRIDHYLGKETAQNIAFFRFGNTVFENVWNRKYIDHVQITVAESVDVANRAGYYDTSGVIRDMFQNHLLQLMAQVTMEPPASFKANAIRNEIAKVLSSVRAFTPATMHERVVLGQYDGYCQTERVQPDSRTPTYAALCLYIDNWRWHGVPFYLRSGKALKTKVSEIVIQFHEPPHTMFPLAPEKSLGPDVLSLCIQPDEGIHFRFDAKLPGTSTETRPVDMTFHYADLGEFSNIPEAYERLLMDALSGDAALFIRGDTIEMSWELVDPIIAAYERQADLPIHGYARGSWGPDAAEELLQRSGRRWLNLCGVHPHDTHAH